MEYKEIDLVEQKIVENCLFDGKIVKLYVDEVKLFDGSASKREYVAHPGGASILAVDRDESVYLIRQFRYPYREVIWEIPAGKLENGEEPIVTAGRELEEEIGFRAGRIEPFGLIYPTPGYTNENLHVFLATELEKTAEHRDEGEFLNVVKMPIQKAYEMVLSGEIHDGKTAYAIMRYMLEKIKK